MVQTKHRKPGSLQHTRSGKAKITMYINDFLDIEDNQEKLSFYSGDLKLATLEMSFSTPTGDPVCDVPSSGNWTVSSNCTIADFQTAPENITITAGTTLTITNTGTLLTITNTGTLEIDLNANSLTIEESGGIRIQTGGNLSQTGKLTPPQNEEESEKKLIYHHPDHLSGASVDTNENGEILQLTDYYPYGDERIEETTTDFHNDYTYTGKERDEDTKLLYYEARYYNSHIGRFISIDPWSGDITDPQSLNKYAYVRNNPLKYTDPSGKIKKDDSLASKVSKIIKGDPKGEGWLHNAYQKYQDNPNDENIGNDLLTKTGLALKRFLSDPKSFTDETWDSSTNEKISKLDSRLQISATDFINTTEEQNGVRLRVTQGYRSVEEQNRLYEQGRSTPGNIVTNAKGGQSYHNYGLALDVVKMDENGQPIWTAIDANIANNAKSVGFEWGGDWDSFPDYPHFQMTFGQSLDDLDDLEK